MEPLAAKRNQDRRHKMNQACKVNTMLSCKNRSLSKCWVSRKKRRPRSMDSQTRWKLANLTYSASTLPETEVLQNIAGNGQWRKTSSSTHIGVAREPDLPGKSKACTAKCQANSTQLLVNDTQTKASMSKKYCPGACSHPLQPETLAGHFLRLLLSFALTCRHCRP